jgi:hypothetical protein
MTVRIGSANTLEQEAMKGKKMVYANANSPARRESTEKLGLLRRIWQAILRFDEALNFDRYDDLAHRISDLNANHGSESSLKIAQHMKYDYHHAKIARGQ